MKKLSNYFLLIILILGFVLRLYRFSSPIADWHSWRQVDTSAVSRSFVHDGFDLLHPKFHDLSNVPSGKDNPEGYRFVEFPLFNLLQAGSFILFNTFTLEQWGRLITIFATSFSTVFIYLIVKKHSDEISGLFSALFYAVLPFNIYYGRTILPDQAMASAILGGIYFFDLWLENADKYKKVNYLFWFYYLISLFFTTIAFLFKPYAIIFTLPIIFLGIRRFGIKVLRKWELWLFAILAFTPLILWRNWISFFPEGVPQFKWLFNEGNIRFKGAFFYWLFAERIGKLILGYWGLSLLTIGVLVNSGREHLKKNGLFFYMFLLSSLIYLTILARGNVQHDYYQILILPTLAIFLGLGSRAIFFPHKEFINPLLSKFVLIVLIFFTVGFSWYYIRDYYNLNYPLIRAGVAIDKILPKNAKVIAPMEGDTTFLYHINRRGWANMQNPLPEMIQKGATHLIILNPTLDDYEYYKEYKVIASDKEYAVFHLKENP